jgi:vitamin B12 transporter
MKKTLLLFTLITIGCIRAQAPTDKTAIDSLKTINNKEVTVYGKGLPMKLTNRTSTIQIIDKNQSNSMPIRSVNEVLSYVPGLDLRQRGVQGIQGDLSIRGGSFDQNLILVNGFKLVDPQTGHHALNLPVLLTNIESIEVYKGSGTRIFGQNAMTGAVNFVTKARNKHGVDMQVSTGDFGGIGTQVTVGAPIGKLSQSFSFGFDKSNGYWYNSDYTNKQYFYDGALPIGKNQVLRALLGYTDRSFGANGYYTPSFPDQWESTQMAIGGISHELKMNKLTLLTKASLRTHRDEFRLKRFEPAFYTNKHRSEVITLEETLKLESKLGESGFGAEYRFEDLSSSNLGERQRTYVSLFLDHSLKFLNNTLILVGNVHYFNLAMNEKIYEKVLPGFEVSYSPIAALKLFGNIGQSYRAPTYTDLFYQDPNNSGNPDLQPEYATNAELGATWNLFFQKSENSKNKSESITIDAALFRRNTSNMIDWVKNISSSPSPWKPVNLSNVIFTGIESNISYRSNKKTFISIREFTLGYNFINVNHEFVDPLMQTQSRYAFSGLRNQLISRLTINLSHWVSLSAAYRGIDRVGGNTYSLMDAKIMVNPSRNLSLFFEGSNILDTDYVEAGYVQMPGRWFKFGIQIAFNK